MDDYEFHYPTSSAATTSTRSRGARRARIYCLATACTSTALRRGGHLVARRRRSATRRVRADRRGGEFAGEIGAHFIIWPGIEGYNYPFQTPYAESWARSSTASGRRATALERHGKTLFLEHKNSEPAMKIFMRNIGMTLHVIHKLRARGSTTSRSTWTGSTCS
jgi:xylose isomerase